MPEARGFGLPVLSVFSWTRWSFYCSSRVPTARVRRGLHDTVIDARDIVPGDLMLVQDGDIFVADGILVSGTPLIVDESTLTGEAHPVVKEPGSDQL